MHSKDPSTHPSTVVQSAEDAIRGGEKGMRRGKDAMECVPPLEGPAPSGPPSGPPPSPQGRGPGGWRGWIVLLASVILSTPVAAQPLAGTDLLSASEDFALVMVEGIRLDLEQRTRETLERRRKTWLPDPPTKEAFEALVPERRERLKHILGVIDERVPTGFLKSGSLQDPTVVAETESFRVFEVRWPVLEGVEGEGLLLEPKGEIWGDLIALPDCDWTPEQFAGLVPGVTQSSQVPRLYAQHGCRVLVPFLIDRNATHSGNPKLRMTNQPHREFLYRAAYEMGRHILGYEVQKILAGADCLKQSAPSNRNLNLFGYGEGERLVLYAAALDERFEAVSLSGSFGDDREMFTQPIYRNVWSYLKDFGDAETASLIFPRTTHISPCAGPSVVEPPKMEGRSGGAPGVLAPVPEDPASEGYSRLREYETELGYGGVRFWEYTQGPIFGTLHPPLDGEPGSDEEWSTVHREFLPGEERLKRQFDQILEHTQQAMWTSDRVRDEYWSKASAESVDTWESSTEDYRNDFWEEVIGKLPDLELPPNARTRLVYDDPVFLGYEVLLDVYSTVPAYGILLVPRNLKEGERRPVVVCQHGLEGRPREVADPAVDSHYYHRFACQLARRGFITYSPQNPYIGGDKFRVLQRMANPLGLSLFSYIIRQHEQTLNWLGSLPFVDPERIAFYGLSYGGKTAMRVPAVLKQYCLSICSGDFNEWIWKNVSYDHGFSYLFTGEYEMPEFDLGNRFNYAEMAGLICPRPFMVERGHDDGVGIDEWVAYEFAKVFRRYDKLGLRDRAEIEYFDGPHTIHGVGTFEFLHKHLGWPLRGNETLR